jgi:hypothetical protein
MTLTKDFYIGVFEVTQRQWELVMGNRPSYFNNSAYYTTRRESRRRSRSEEPEGAIWTAQCVDTALANTRCPL